VFKRLAAGLRGRTNAIQPAAPAESAATGSYRILYTHGDELLTPGQYRASFEQTITRALGGQAHLDDYTLARALGVSSTAFACTEYDANTTSGLPIVVRDPRQEPLMGTPFTWFQSQSPRLMALIIRSLDIWGHCYLWKRPNPYGWKTGLEWINPQRVRELTSAHMRVIGYEIRDEWGYVQVGNAPVDDVVVIEAFDSDPTGAGLSKFEVAWRYLGIELGLATHAAAFFTNSARIDGMLTFERDMKPEELEDARREWKRFKGATNAHQTAVMPGGATWTAVQATPKDLAMDALSEVDEKRIVAIWGMHRALLGLGDVADPLSANSTYSGLEINFVRNIALPRAENVVLAALNEQWAWRDFDQQDYYTLAIDRQAIPQLAEAQLAKSETSVNLAAAGVTDLDEARTMIGYRERTQGDFLVRDPTLPRVALESGAITLAQYRQMILGSGGDDPSADVVVIGGQLLPANRLLEIASANADRLTVTNALVPIPPNANEPPGGSSPTPGVSVSVPQLPAGTDASNPARAGASVCIALDLANQPDLVALQRRVQALYGGQPVEWNPPDKLHCTLLTAPLVDEGQVEALVRALWDVDVPELTLRVGSLNSFDNVGEHALHFRIRENADLREFQQAMYALVTGMGIPASAFSQPEAYKPHVTMGRMQQKPAPVTYLGKVSVRANAIIVWKDEEAVYSSADENADAAMGVVAQRPDLADNLSQPDTPPVRSLAPLLVAVDFSENQFVKYARRTLSEALTAQNVLDAEWVAPVDWRLELATVMEWTPNAAAQFLRSIDLAEMRKLDLPTNGWYVEGNTVYLSLWPSDTLDALRASLVIDLEAADLSASPNWVRGIAVARLSSPDLVQLDQFPTADYPLVGATVRLIGGGAIQHQWALRGASSAQLKELQSWRNLVRRKGRDYAFNAEALPPLVALYVRLALDDGEEEADIFETARGLLTRSYAQTRGDYIQAVTDILVKALSDEGTRRELGTTMRQTARLYGLQAASDALADAGLSAESLSADDVTLFRAWLAETSGYITNLGAEIFKEGGVTEAMIAGRAQLWANKSLDDLYFTLLRQNAPTKRVTWRRKPGKKSCDTCQENDGQTLTLDDWGKRGFPRDRRLDCGGWECECDLVDENGKVLRSR
jgi:HK97 family phage portal protein